MLIVWPNTMPRLRHFTRLHLDELHGEGGLAHAAAAEHHDLILTHGDRCRPSLLLLSLTRGCEPCLGLCHSACLPGVYCSTAVVWCISEIFTFEQTWVTTSDWLSRNCELFLCKLSWTMNILPSQFSWTWAGAWWLIRKTRWYNWYKIHNIIGATQSPDTTAHCTAVHTNWITYYKSLVILVLVTSPLPLCIM